jgi:DNA-binding NarL/FixJ family response regulator
VLVVDDQAVVRDGMVLLLGLMPDIEVVGSAGDGEAAIAMVAEHRPDVVLMDLRMPRMDGVNATRRVRADFPDTQVIVLTTYADDKSVFGALRAGARGFLTKSAGAEEIAAAIATVMEGEAQLDPSVQRRLLESVTAPPPEPAPAAPRSPVGADPSPPRRLPDGLTAREAEVLRLIASGMSNADIAAKLFVSEATVKTHINNAYTKAGLRSRTQAVTYAYRHGLARPQ